MHIPDGFVCGPVNVAGYAVSAAMVAAAMRQARKTLGDKEIPLLGTCAAFIFAAQMLNFPVAGGTSGHFLGALLAALLLGPLNACLVMSLVLVVQCLLFSDGGLTALGTNIFNMAIVGGWVSYGLFILLRRILPATGAGQTVATAIAAWLSVILASGCCAIELALSGTSLLALVFPAMLGIHALIGIGEAMITVAVVSVIAAARPDLLTGMRLAPVRVTPTERR